MAAPKVVIFALSTELLLKILSYFAFAPYGSTASPDLFNLLLICKEFYQISLPLLYRNINLGILYNGFDPRDPSYRQEQLPSISSQKEKRGSGPPSSHAWTNDYIWSDRDNLKSLLQIPLNTKPRHKIKPPWWHSPWYEDVIWNSSKLLGNEMEKRLQL